MVLLNRAEFLVNPEPGDEVVITGMAGRFPESDNVDEFLRNLFDKKELISDDDRRWKHVNPEIPHRIGKINYVEKLDAGAFGLHYQQVQKTDPLIRIIVERAYECILDAGFNTAEMRGSKTGVFVGYSFSETERVILHQDLKSPYFGLVGTCRSVAAQLISSVFGFEGPSILLDTACSSAMHSLESAYRAIREGTCDNAFVGGMNLCLSSLSSLQFNRLGVLSPDASCKVFDERANGYVRSECIAGIFLQRAKNARRIYAQVVHSKANADGYKEQGPIYPSGPMQAVLILDTYKDCNIDPSSIDYLEAHGTGTFVGDQEEMTAMDEVYCKNRVTPLIVGSVKSYAGHTESASAICSLIKVLLSMESGYILPNINFEQPRKSLKGLIEGRMVVPTENILWPSTGSGLVGVNSSGFGGSNVHALLKRFYKPKTNNGSPLDDLPRLVCISGRTQVAVDTILNDVGERNLDIEYIRLLQQTFKNTGLEHTYRGYIVQSKQGTITKSVSLVDVHKMHLVLLLTPGDKVLLLLAQQLLAAPTFRSTLTKIDSILPHKITPLITNNCTISQADLTICTVAIHLGLIHLFISVNLHFNAVVGSSEGKIGAAYSSGSLSLEEAISHAYHLATGKNLNGPVSQLPENSTDITRSTVITLNQTTLNCLQQIEISTINSFLKALGTFHVLGYNLNCEGLYPDVPWPVSSGTPKISPLIRWNYSDNWFVCLDLDKSLLITLVSKEIDWSDLPGHSIDNIVLMPATGYLYLVLHGYCKTNLLDLVDSRTVFEQVRFHRAIPIPKEIQNVSFHTSIFRNTSRFEITSDNQTVVTGYIRKLEREELSDIPQVCEQSDEKELNVKDIYKEFKLRGYNYTGAFRSIDRAYLNGKVSWVKWHNLITFIDNMLQTTLLQHDTRNLYVPTTLSQLVLDIPKHLDYVKSFGDEAILPVYSWKEANAVRCGGIYLRGLCPTTLPRRKIRSEPVLEKYVFVPFKARLSLKEAVRVCVQILLENVDVVNVKTVEVFEDGDPLAPLVLGAVEDQPMVKCDITVLSKVQIGIPHIKVVDENLDDESLCSLVILPEIAKIEQAKLALNDIGFIIVRGFTCIQTITDLQLVSVITTEKESLFLFKKCPQILNEKMYRLSLDGSNFDWLPAVQDFMKNGTRTLLVSEGETCNGALGFFNCLKREPGGNLLRLCLIMDSSVRFTPDDKFLKKSLTVNVLKNGEWGTYRHLVLKQQELVQKSNAVCHVTRIGDLSSFKWIERPDYEDNTIPIKVYYSAINFKDLVLASGLVSSDIFTKSRLEQVNCVRQGMEFSGIDPKGRRVMGLSVLGGSLSDTIEVDSTSLWDVPDQWTMQEAATIPVCYSTVIQGLMTARIKKGDSVLIHAGSGGIGQAAMYVATEYKCDIFTTVSTEEKRQFVKTHFPNIPDSHIGNSRDTTFVEMVFKETRGRGVDIVLNSLTDDKLQASLRCLAPRGRFVEIGKYDLFRNKELGIALLAEGRTYCSVMLDILINNSKSFKKELINVVSSFVRNGVAKPLHYTVFDHTEVEKAYRFMASGKHVGKLLVRIKNEDTSPPVFECLPRFYCKPYLSYIIVGGLGGVGLELADWLVLRGARKLVLVSRTGLKSNYAASRISAWKSYEVTVTVSTHDVTTRDGCVNLLQSALHLGDVTAIFNTALVLKDELLENQSGENFLNTLAPKAVATKHLDLISRDLCPNLQHFVVFSSMSCGRGNIGQTPYGMANSIMERICETRKAEGYPGLAIQWGVIGDVGIVAENQEREIEICGTLPQRIDSCLNTLDVLLTQNDAIVSSMVIAEKRSGSDDIAGVIDVIKNILGITDLKTVSEHATLPELGMDSMTALEIKLTLERDCDIFLNPKDIRTMTFAKLRETIDNRKELKETATTKDKHATFYKFIGEELEANLPVKRLKTLINDDAKAPVIFLLPGFEGMANIMEPLTCNLEAHAYCLQYVYNTPQQDTVDFLAQSLLRHIPAEEHFKIIAYSYGGAVARALIQLLEERGQRGTLVLVDGSFEWTKAAIEQVPGAEIPAVLETSVLISLLELYLDKEEAARHQSTILKYSTLSDRIEYVLSVAGKNSPHSIEYQRQVCFKSCTRLSGILSHKPVHRKVQSKVVLFKCSQPYIDNFLEDYGVQAWCENPVRVEVIESNHFTIMKSVDLATRINVILKEI